MSFYANVRSPPGSGPGAVTTRDEQSVTVMTPSRDVGDPGSRALPSSSPGKRRLVSRDYPGDRCLRNANANLLYQELSGSTGAPGQKEDAAESLWAARFQSWPVMDSLGESAA